MQRFRTPAPLPVLLGILVGILLVSLFACNNKDSAGGLAGMFGSENTAALQAQLAADHDQILALQSQTEAARVAANSAYETALLVGDQLAASAAQKKIDDAKQAADILATAATVNNTARAGTTVLTGGDGWQSQLASLGGLLPPPWGTIITLGGTSAIGLYQRYQRGKDQAANQAAMSAVAKVANYGNTPGVTATDQAIHEEAVVSTLSPAAKAAYNASPDFSTRSDNTTAAYSVGTTVRSPSAS